MGVLKQTTQVMSETNELSARINIAVVSHIRFNISHQMAAPVQVPQLN